MVSCSAVVTGTTAAASVTGDQPVCRPVALEWWLPHGIQIARIKPGHPEQNGRPDE
jgi:hypothetical protein